MGKGKSPKATTQTQVQDVPAWAKPYYTDLIGKSKALSEQPYQAYGGQRVADDTADLATSQQMIRGIAGQPIPGFDYSAGMMGGLGSMAFGLGQQQPGQFRESQFRQAGVSPYFGFQQTGVSPYAGFSPTAGQEYQGFQAGQASPFADFQAGQFQATGVSPYAGFQQTGVDPFSGFQAARGQEFEGFQAGQGEAFQFDPARQFGGAEVEQYMSPYMDAVVGRQQEDAIEQFERQRAGRDARAVSAGAFGGSRQAVQEGIAEESLGRQLGDIRATGTQQAFEQAQQQFERDRSAQMQQQQAQAQELARTQDISVEEAARVQSSIAQERARIQQMDTSEFARVQQSQAAELARIQGISVEEAARVQAAEAQEIARTQGISVEEAARVQAGNIAEQGRVQQGQAQELARTQGISVEEAARVQQATAQERARLQAMDADEFARVQQGQAQELARVQGISVDEAARVQAAQAQELARVQGISVDEAARVQAARAGEAARVQQARADESMRQREFQLQTMGFSADMAREIANLGERARQGDIQAAQLLESQGLGQMAREQARLDIGYEDFLRQQQYPQQQLANYSSILRGLPIGDAGTTTTSQPYNPMQQALGAGISALGLYQGMR
jgi:hypothetical protein